MTNGCTLLFLQFPWFVSQETCSFASFAATWMDLEIIIFSEVSQKKKDKYMILLICGILKKDTNELIYKIEIHLQT